MAVTATFTADFTNFFDAVDEATVHLKSFEQDAVKINKSLDRMGESFSGKKIIQEATLMAKAIEDAGGLAKLTDAELQRVGRTAAEATEKMRALGMEVPANLQKLADATKGAGAETDALSVSVFDMVKAYVSAEAIIGIVTSAYHALVGGVTAAITSASEAEEADRKLLAALEAQGTAMPSVLAAYQAYAAELQKTTVYSDDAVTAATALLVQVGGVMPRDMQKALQATTNLAAGLGKDLPEAAMIMAKAATGSTEALNKYGIETEDANGKTLDFAGTVDAINEKFAGAATAAADTYAGRLAQLANTWDNVQESVGRAVVQNESVMTLVEGLTGVITTQTGELNDNATANNLVSDAAILLAKGASLAAEGIQFIGTAALAARTAVDAFGLGLAHSYEWMQKIELWTQKKVNWTLGTEESAKRVAEATENLKWADQQINELRGDMAAAVTTNKEWTDGINAMQGRLSAVVVEMEAARGKTRELAASQHEAADAFARATGGLNAELIAADQVAKGVGGIKTGFGDLEATVAQWGLNTKVASLGAFQTMKDASADAMQGIVTGADGAAAAVFKITTEATAAADAIAGLSAVQSGAQLALPQGGSGEAYAPWAIGHNVNPLVAYELSKRYGTGVVGRTANAFTLGAGMGGGSTAVTVEAGAVQMQYPIMNDRRAMDELAGIVGEAIMSKLTRAGKLA